MCTIKNWQIKDFKKIGLYLLIVVVSAFLVNGCARWPNGTNGDNGIMQKLLSIKVEMNENGTINTNEGYYYVVFDTDKNAPFAPDDNIDNWKKGYYYIKLDAIGFFFGEVLETGTSEQFMTGTRSDNYFQVTVSLADLGNPEGIHMNVITTDTDNETYDALDTDFYIDTSLLFPKTETDFLEDSTGGPDFDIAKVTTTILIP